jgi:malonyl-CoA O-methyltransferase
LRWQRIAAPQTDWLHAQVAQRMFERLQWIRAKPQAWTHWAPLNTGADVNGRLLAELGPRASLVEADGVRQALARELYAPPWWRWQRLQLAWQEPAEQSQDMVWANLVLHTALDPQALLLRWHGLLRVDGFVMFSCLGPDTAVEMRALYDELGWPAAGAALTDMHDWGDMLVGCGFAEPVMDMEKLTLTFDSGERLLAELRQWGRNVHPARFAALRARSWRQRLLDAIEQRWPRQSDGRLGLTVELVYGHALRAPVRLKADAVTALPLQHMRDMLKGSRPRVPPDQC